MRIYDGREFFYQWDTGQKIAGVFKAGEEVHVSCSCGSAALPVIAYELGGLIVADVPDSMLQRAGVLNAYIMRADSSGRATKEEFSFVIKPRKKPADYVYTPTEAQTYEALEKRIEALEQGGGTGGGSGADGKSAYEIALEHGFEGSEQEWLESLNGEDGKDGYTPQKGIDYVDGAKGDPFTYEDFTEEQLNALKGADGKDGQNGQDGKTPQKGVDYFTEADKQEIAKQAAQLVGVPEGGSGGGSGEWELIGEVTSDGAGDTTGISIPCDLSGYKQVFVVGANLVKDTTFRIVMRKARAWYNYACFFGYNKLGKQYDAPYYAINDGKMSNIWSITGMAYNIDGRILAYGAAESKDNGGSAPWRQGLQDGIAPKTGEWDEIKYISLDRNSNTDIVPEGCTLIAWGLK